MASEEKVGLELLSDEDLACIVKGELNERGEGRNCDFELKNGSGFGLQGLRANIYNSG